MVVNSDLKKLAVKKGMKISHNICYGNLNGYTVTLRDINNGRMIRELYISTVINQDVKNKILEALNSANAQKQYKIDFIDVNDSYISIGFVVSMGIMKRLEPFIDWFMPIVAAWSRSLYAQCMCTGTY